MARRSIRPGTRFRTLAFLGMLLAASAGPALAVSVSPAALYIDHNSRTAQLTLFNPGSLPADVEISFAFGYPQSDATGRVSVPLFEVAPEGEPSAMGWLRAFPRRLSLAPGERQTIRIMAQPPADLPDGEYWARVLVTSRGGQPPIEQVQGATRVQIDLETVVVTAVSYRKGPMASGLTVVSSSAERTAEGIDLVLDLQREGNAAYLGRLRVQLVAPGGAVLAEGEDHIAVYRSIRRRLSIPLEQPLAPGTTVRYVFDTNRPDLPSGGPLPVEPVTGTFALP
jgi:hypothetical protein